MSIFYFERYDEDSLVVVDCKIQNHRLALAVDTGASHTVVDLTALLLVGLTMNDVVGTLQLETAKGVVDAYIFRLKKISALGKTLENVEVCSYDFIGNAVLSDFEGVLGLDFFRNTELIINFKNNTIELL